MPNSMEESKKNGDDDALTLDIAPPRLARSLDHQDYDDLVSRTRGVGEADAMLRPE